MSKWLNRWRRHWDLARIESYEKFLNELTYKIQFEWPLDEKHIAMYERGSRRCIEQISKLRERHGMSITDLTGVMK